MSDHSPTDSDRWEELQAARLLFGLTAEEQAELDRLARERLAQDPADEDHEPFDDVVAALDVAWSGNSVEPLPEHLRQAIRTRAEQELAARPATGTITLASDDRPAASPNAYLPWLVAAACLIFAVFVWNGDRPTKPARKPVASVVKQRAALLAEREELVQATWAPGTTPVGDVTGDVVWSAKRQRGYMRFRGLPVNSPTKEQYQLWIFDKNQSDKTPIDGGVFDIATTEETIIPINAKLRVQEAFLFAITIEKPGGVVVSSRERLPLLAKVE